MSLTDRIKSVFRRWFYTYRDGSGRFITKAQYDKLDERDRIRHEHKRKPDAATLAENFKRANRRDKP